MSESKKNMWEDSYHRGENYIYYPHEELIRFLSRFVRKKTGAQTYTTVLEGFKDDAISALDFGCGIGTVTRTIRDLNIDVIGVDISEQAIKVAREMQDSSEQGMSFDVISAEGELPYTDASFHFFTSCCVLDSMPFDYAKKIMLELSRVTTHIGYISLIAGDYMDFNGEEVVKDKHENGTIQSYFDLEKCKDLVSDTGFEIKSCELVTKEVLLKSAHSEKIGRYHLTIEKRS